MIEHFFDPAEPYRTARLRKRLDRRRRHEPRSMVFAGLVAAICGLFVPCPGVTQTVPEMTRSACVSFPTVECVFDLALDAAGEITSSDLLLDAYVHIGKTQVHAGVTKDAEDTLARALLVAKTLAETDDATLGRAYSGSKLGDDDMGRYLKAGALVSILELQVALGQVAAARETFTIAVEAAAMFEWEHLRSELLVSIASVALTMGDLLGDVAVLAEDEIDPFEERTHFEVAIAQAAAGDAEDALRTVERMQQVDDVGRGIFGYNAALAAIARQQALARDYAGAVATAERIEHPYFAMLAFLEIGVVQAGADDIDGAEVAAKRIRKIWEESVDGYGREMESLLGKLGHAISNAYLRSGAYDKALAQAENAAGGQSFAAIHRDVVREQIRSGDLTAAGATIEAFCPWHHYNHYCVEALADLATAYALFGDVGLANQVIASGYEVAERISYRRNRIRAFLDIRAAMLAMNDSDRAGDALSKAIEAADTVEDLHGTEGVDVRVESLIEIVEWAAGAGDSGGAEQAIAVALTRVADLEGKRQRVDWLSRIASAQRTVGDLESARATLSQALVVAYSIEEETFGRVAALVEVASSLAESSDR